MGEMILCLPGYKGDSRQIEISTGYRPGRRMFRFDWYLPVSEALWRDWDCCADYVASPCPQGVCVVEGGFAEFKSAFEKGIPVRRFA